MNRILTSFLFGFIFLSSTAYGELENFKIGPEFTFTNSTFLNENNHNFRMAKVKEVYDFYKRTLSTNEFEISPFSEVRIDGHVYFSIKLLTAKGGPLTIDFTRDPGVLEVRMTPQNLEDVISNESQLQRVIFDVLAQHDLKPHAYQGGGHLNFNGDIFEDRPLFLRNALIHFVNHSELGSGILGDYNYLVDGAQTVAQHGSISEFKTLMAAIDSRLDNFAEVRKSWRMANQSAITLHTSSEKQLERFELRMVYPQKSAREFTKQAVLFHQIFLLLKSLDVPLKIEDKIMIYEDRTATRMFYDFITQAGLKWEHYLDFLPPRFKRHASTIQDFPELGLPLSTKLAASPCLQLVTAQ